MRGRVTASQTTRLFPFLPHKFSPLLDIRHYTTHTHFPHMGSHFSWAIILTFQQPIGRLALPHRFLTENFPRCQDPCLEAPPTGLPPLVQLQ
ncbi:hypothetical protein TNCV_497061 [Trichonephila clavipes]|nr:hypothetical protein TNCV_497061 [Trichonephila clavipes]